MLNVFRYSVLVAFVNALVFLANPVAAQPAPDANSVLVLSSTNGGGHYSAAATAAGFTVVLATDAQWGARTTAEFATFKALIIGDPTCSTSPGSGGIAAVTANAATWSAAIDGPTLIIGTDENFHYSSGGSTLIASGIAFVTSGTAGQTGLYMSLSCYYDGAAPTTVAALASLGTFTAADAPGCFNDSHIVAIHPALAGSTDASLSNWSCSVHEIFQAFPSGYIPVAIARGVTGPGSMTFGDGSTGTPYILATGGGIVAIGSIIQNIPTMTEWGLMLLAVLLAASATLIMRRRAR